MKNTASRCLYSILSFAARILVGLRLNLEVESGAGKIEGPAVILVNHMSNMDWLISTYVLRHNPVRFVVGRYQFRNPIKAKLFLMMGSIPKEQFYPDIQTIRMVSSAIRSGEIVVIFPSGQSSYSGESTLIPFETAKLLKKLCVPVFHIHINGAHLKFPKWDMKRIRKGKATAAFVPVFTGDELAAIDEIEIYERISSLLHFDDYEWQREHRVSLKKSRSLEGLEFILFTCPQCKAEFGMSAARNVLSCEHCGYSASMDSCGFLSSDNQHFDTPTQWYRWQLGEIAKEVQGIQAYSFTANAQLTAMTRNGKLLERHEGALSISDGVLSFSSRTMAASLAMDVKLQPMLFQHESLHHFEFIYGEGLYRFRPEPRGGAAKLVILKEIYYLLEKQRTAKRDEARVLYEKILADKTRVQNTKRL